MEHTCAHLHVCTHQHTTTHLHTHPTQAHSPPSQHPCPIQATPNPLLSCQPWTCPLFPKTCPAASAQSPTGSPCRRSPLSRAGPGHCPPRVQPAQRPALRVAPGCDPQGCELVLEKPWPPHRCLFGQLWGRAGHCPAVTLRSVSGRRWMARGLSLHIWRCLKAPPDPGLGMGGTALVGGWVGPWVTSAPAPPVPGGLPGHGGQGLREGGTAASGSARGAAADFPELVSSGPNLTLDSGPPHGSRWSPACFRGQLGVGVQTKRGSGLTDITCSRLVSPPSKWMA